MATSTTVGDTTHLFYSSRTVCADAAGPRPHIDHNNPRDARDEISIPPGPARCQIATLPPTQQSILRDYDTRHTSGHKKFKSITQKISTVRHNTHITGVLRANFRRDTRRCCRNFLPRRKKSHFHTVRIF